VLFLVYMGSINNIIFDLGNVLLDIDYSLTADRLSDVTGLDINRDLMEYGEIFKKFETGKIPYVVFFNHLTKISPKKAIINDMLPAWNAMLIGMQPEIPALLDSLSMNYSLFILSNTNEIHIQWLDKYLKQENIYEKWYHDWFRQIFYSHQLGLRKPEKQCFEEVLIQSNILPEATLFVDDNVANVNGSIEAGICGVLYDKSQKSLVDFLRNDAQLIV